MAKLWKRYIKLVAYTPEPLNTSYIGSEKASGVAENEVQKKALDLIIEYYESGDLRTFDEYSIAWTKDTSLHR